jgi:hypothetical protein
MSATPFPTLEWQSNNTRTCKLLYLVSFAHFGLVYPYVKLRLLLWHKNSPGPSDLLCLLFLRPIPPYLALIAAHLFNFCPH